MVKPNAVPAIKRNKVLICKSPLFYGPSHNAKIYLCLNADFWIDFFGNFGDERCAQKARNTSLGLTGSSHELRGRTGLENGNLLRLCNSCDPSFDSADVIFRRQQDL